MMFFCLSPDSTEDDEDEEEESEEEKSPAGDVTIVEADSQETIKSMYFNVKLKGRQ